MRKEIKELVALAEKLGYVHVRRTSEGHYLMQHTVTGKRVQVPSTPSGGKRSIENCRAAIRRNSDPNRP